MFELEECYFCEDGYSKWEEWDRYLAAIMWDMRSTIHTTLQYSAGQLAFSRDMVVQAQHDANWRVIYERKQRRARQNNDMENKKRIDHMYCVGDFVLVDHEHRKLHQPYEGPYKIKNIYSNGCVEVQKGPVD